LNLLAVFRIDLAPGNRRHLVADPNHRVAAFAAPGLNLEAETEPPREGALIAGAELVIAPHPIETANPPGIQCA
jgi:hypothetical protein